MFPGVPKSMLTLWPDLRSNSGTRLVITARAPPVEMTFISAASTWVARAQTKPTITPVHFIPPPSLPAEFPSQVPKVEIVLTGRLDDVAIRHQAHLFLHLPRLGINLWVVDRNLNFHVPEVRPPETFNDVQRIGRGFARLIQPCLSIETACVDDQGVAIPLAGGIT